MVNNIHHINFIVKDLEDAVAKYLCLPGVTEFAFDKLEQRAVRTAKAKLGDTWLVLVQPTEKDTVPGRYLAEHGEGFFLLSLATDNLERSIAEMEAQGVSSVGGGQRSGLDNWLVQDLDPESFCGVQIQFAEDV